MTGRFADNGELAAALERLLPRVEKPTRYLGGEVNQRVKAAEEVRLRVALAFPDLYEIGMSHLGFRILYALLNDLDRVAAERAFMPWSDMLGLLRAEGLPLTSLESRAPLSSFDVVGFSLQYELAATNVLAMLELGGIPLLAAEREEGAPLVLAGGPAASNPEPFAPFFDLILLGDGEEAFPEALAELRRLKDAGTPRAEIVRRLARLEGWYAPGLYDVARDERTGFLLPRPKAGEDVPARVKRRVVLDLDAHPFPAAILVPHAEIVHDRVSWEIMRGCPTGCRFCQAGYLYRPTRERNPAAVREGVRASIAATGYDEFSLTSLNSGKYGAMLPLLTALMDEMAPRRVSVGLSSLHATTLSEELAAQVRRVRKTGFTMAPEAGSQRLRDVINKNLDEEQILRAARLAFEAGWDLVKLYFMIGLPTETDEDVDALVDLAGRVARLGRELRGPRAKVTLSASTFVPKAFTPFQFCGMNREEDVAAKQRRIRARLPRGVQFKHHDHGASWLEGALSRADRSAARAILEAYRRGAVLDGWTEMLDVARWREAFAAAGIDADDWATRALPVDAELPWEVVDPLIRRPWLEREWDRATRAERTAPCDQQCGACASFAKECASGVVAQRRWTTLPDEGPQGPDAAPEAAFAAAAADGARESARGDEADHARGDESDHARGDETDRARGDEAEGARGAEAEAPAAAAPPAPVYRHRLLFEKLGRARFLGHLDLVRAMTMAFRRAGVPLAYSCGFKPHPRLSFTPALALGVGSRGEFVDVDTTGPLDAESAIPRIDAALPEGLRVLALVPADLDAAALQDAVRFAVYRARLPLAPDALAERVAAFLAAESVPIVRARKGRERALDLRPLVAEMSCAPDGELRFALRVSVEGSARPVEILEWLAGKAAAAAADVERTELLAEAGGRRVSPLLLARRRMRE